MKKKLVLKIIIFILFVVTLVYIFNISFQKKLIKNKMNDGNDEIILEDQVPLSINEITKEELKEKVINISTANEVIINNKNIEEDLIDAMIVDIDYDEYDNEVIKIILVNGESYEAVLINDALNYIDSLNIADEIKFNGEVKEGKIYISKVVEIKPMMEGIDV